MKTRIKALSVIAVLCFSSVARAQFDTTAVIDEPTFGRFEGGWECARAATWNENRFWRDKRPDTTYHTRAGNPTRRATVERVKRCMARFTLSNTAQRDMLGAIQAILASENEAQADAAADNLATALGRNPEAEFWALYQIADIYLGAAQPKIRQAERYIARLDAAGAPAAMERMLAYLRLANVARFQDSLSLWETALKASLAASKQMTGDARKEYAYEAAGVYLALADLYGRKNDPQAAVRAIETGRAELVPLRPSLARYFEGKEEPYLLMGQQARPVQATRWFNTKGSNLHPIPGKPAMLVHVSHSCGSMCYPGYAVLRRLRAKFEAKGLDIVLMSQTQGFYRDRLVKPDSEMIYMDNYFRNIIQMPTNLAVWQVDFGKRDDGKLTVFSSPNREGYRGSLFLVDAQGEIRYVSNPSSANEAILEDIITALLPGA